MRLICDPFHRLSGASLASGAEICTVNSERSTLRCDQFWGISLSLKTDLCTSSSAQHRISSIANAQQPMPDEDTPSSDPALKLKKRPQNANYHITQCIPMHTGPKT